MKVVYALHLALTVAAIAQTIPTAQSASNIEFVNHHQTFQPSLSVGYANALPSVEAHETQTTFGDWTDLPSFSPVDVDNVSIASDNSSIVVFYGLFNPSTNTDNGVIVRWNGQSWTTMNSNVTGECSYPHVSTSNGFISGAWQGDAGNWRWINDFANGSWFSSGSSSQTKEYGITTAFAQGRPYLCFTSRSSDGNPFPYMMLHIISPFWPGTEADLDGGWREPGYDVGTDPAFFGDSTGWYAAFTQNGYIYAKRGVVTGTTRSVTDVGGGFRYSSTPSNLAVVSYHQQPMVVWTEDGGSKLFVARYSGSQWILLRGLGLPAGYFYEVAASVIGSRAYIAAMRSVGSPRVIVERYNGIAWQSPSVPFEHDSASSLTSLAVGTYNDEALIAFRENSQHRILAYDPSTAATTQDDALPLRPYLHAYPNPFNPETRISYTLTTSEPVSLRIFDALGRELSTLVHEQGERGTRAVTWNASGYPSGVYFAVLYAGPNIRAIKLILSR